MLNQTQNIKSKILGKSKEYSLLDSWHYLMIHYGWISFEEFKKLDAYIVGELVTRINEMNEKANKQNRGKR